MIDFVSKNLTLYNSIFEVINPSHIAIELVRKKVINI